MVQDNADGYFIDDSTGPKFPEDSQRAGQQLHFQVVQVVGGQAEKLAVQVDDQLGLALLPHILGVPTPFEAGAATLAAFVAVGAIQPTYQLAISPPCFLTCLSS
jgi:hypothetical protein